MNTVRIGAGAGYSGDRIEPAVELAKQGSLDFLVFECLAERTIALAQLARAGDPEAGYDPMLVERMEAVLPACAARRTRIVTNMGAANPGGAARAIVSVARRLGLTGLRVAFVTGDDVLDLVRNSHAPLIETEGSVSDVASRIVSANAYLGMAPIVDALTKAADVVVTGRVGDPAMFLAPLAATFGWAEDDWACLGAGTSVGHLLECAGQVTGGYFADPGRKEVAGLARLGFPLAEVAEDGSAIITKVSGSGGTVTLQTCKEQLLYEVHDPSRYLQPDVVADFSAVRFEQVGPDRVSVSGGTGHPRPDKLKVSIGYHDGFVGEGEISYVGEGAKARAELAGAIVSERLRISGAAAGELRLDLIGVDAVLRGGTDAARRAGTPAEVRLRAVARAATAADARKIGREVEALYTNGPAGGGGARQTVREVIAVVSMLIDRAHVRPVLGWEVA